MTVKAETQRLSEMSIVFVGDRKLKKGVGFLAELRTARG